ncbi:Aldolase-type TIM barrel [Syntrophomonas zehnderi OL-4]|uniref:Aldolase-type TIM barrel n=1 Tax=Syntrophomonas zehnderi OL-4 TaxID=690567 RepID=A0A0E4C829_9FIRM|nr:DUF512 domain-containing protein [Syntrophomonas zehnderi]CFX21161.1 Aldolase-type TIM barrel [Syntrophomonas zehnderi OL-4]
MTVEIKNVRANSVGAEMEIEAGDILLSINNQPINDILDYQYYAQDDCLQVEIMKSNQEIWSLEIEKDYDEDLGLEFEGIVFDQMKACSNRCIFCFVDQLPRKMRKTLYVKDDDYRYSFLYGNYITLTNLSEDDWRKIIKMRLSPLYISVHCTQGELRSQMLQNPRAAGIKADLARLKEAGIQVHTQIVLCPGVNDGQVLNQTITELAEYYPAVQSVGIVPVGLTGYREKLPELKPVSRQQAKQLIKTIDRYQQRFRRQTGQGFVYLADEFYLRAQMDLPPDEYYDDYCQLENGIGLSRLLLEEFEQIIPSLPSAIEKREVIIITGLSAAPVLELIQARLSTISGLNLKLLPVENRFFGGAISVAGLLTGRDIIDALGQTYKGNVVLIPEVLLRDGQETLLDDITIQDIRESSRAKIDVVDGTAEDLINKILGR